MSDTLEAKLWAVVYNTFCLLGNEFRLFERTSCALLLRHLTSPAIYYILSQKDFFPLTLPILSIFLWNYLVSFHVLHYLHTHENTFMYIHIYIGICLHIYYDDVKINGIFGKIKIFLYLILSSKKLHITVKPLYTH